MFLLGPNTKHPYEGHEEQDLGHIASQDM